jgi:hypothetical protein
MRYISMVMGELLQLLQFFGRPDEESDEESIELALAAAMALRRAGLERDAVLVWLDQVYAQPDRFLSDPALAPLATRLSRLPRDL